MANKIQVAAVTVLISALGLLGGCGTKARTEDRSVMMSQQMEQSAQRAEQAAVRAEQAALRAEQAAERTEQAAGKALQMAEKAERIFTKRMKK